MGRKKSQWKQIVEKIKEESFGKPYSLRDVSIQLRNDLYSYHELDKVQKEFNNILDFLQGKVEGKN